MSDLHPKLNDYLQSVIPSRPKTLAAMERYAKKHNFPSIGPLAGRLLYQQAYLFGVNNSKAKIRVFELGSGYGYTAYWFSLALGKRAEIHLTDNDESNLDMARQYFRQGRLKSTFIYHVGDALESFGKVRSKFDIVLNDIHKTDYPAVVKTVVPRLNKGGLLISDNLVWSGKVFGRNRDKATKSVREYTRLCYAHPKLFTTIIPIRDGVGISVKL